MAETKQRRARTTLNHLVREMSRVATAVRARLVERLAAGTDERLNDAWQALRSQPLSEMTADEFADHWSQVIVCGTAVGAMELAALPKAAAWLLDSASGWQATALTEIFAAASLNHECLRYLLPDEANDLRRGVDATAGHAPAEHLYERFLQHHARAERRRKGVFFTPPPIARYMVQQVDRLLRVEFDLADGLADRTTWRAWLGRHPHVAGNVSAERLDEPLVRIIDPAAGAGVFLTAAIDCIHCRFAGSDWSRYVVEQLLPRLWGLELLPTPCLLAQLHIAGALGRTGFDFERPGRINIAMGNALVGPETAALPVYSDPFTVVVGNPPFSYLSVNQSPWITQLIRGSGDVTGYLEYEGERLGEKKTWLHDDYVKFLRLAQWRIEQTGCGIVAFVTNHGYLDNATFRILRRQLLKALPRITSIDLHGNRKKGEVAPDGSRDENVFQLDQGVCIGLLRRTGAVGDAPHVEYAELWGSRSEKLERLTRAGDDNPLATSPITPQPPDWKLVPATTTRHHEYEQGVSLPELMPVYTTVPVTARDGVVVAFTKEELLARMERFCDLSIADETIRQEFFPRARTARYPAGDTRGWKLADARRIVAAETDLTPFVERCLYRPFDWRFIFWHPAMIDWPRSEVMRHLLPHKPEARAREMGLPLRPRRSEWPTAFPSLALRACEDGANLGLIARRQMLPTHPCTFFWVTDCLTLDGVIRSDNRGSEAVFPLLLNEGSANLAQTILQQLPCPASPADVVHYAYALFHAPGYRERYADELRRAFPRVVLPRSAELFTSVARLGQTLVELHLLRASPLQEAADEKHNENPIQDPSVAAGYPRWENGAIFITPQTPLASASEEAWQFRAGGHQVLKKWLADRRGRALTAQEVRTYREIVAAIEQTLELAPRIDEEVERSGGWPAAFR